MPRKKTKKPLSRRLRSIRRKRFSKRDYDSPQYRNWRSQVYERDEHKCQWPGCKTKKALNAHHIKKWAEYPLLRFYVSNGITLCKHHHDHIKNKEHEHENLFRTILTNKLLQKLRTLQ